MEFDVDRLRELISGRVIGRKIHFLEKVDSTNIYAAKLASEGADEGEIVIADCQTKGKGRLGRIWQSPIGKNLYTSIILRPSIGPPCAPQLTLTVGVAVAEVVSKYCSGRVTLKWPNDVLVEGKKICGILSEMRTKGQEIDFVVIGIGININIDKKDFNEEFRNTSTSLKEENSAEISRTDFAAGLCRSLEKWYNRFITLGFPPVRDKWMEYSGLLGKYIEVKNRDEVQRGRVIEIDERGALVLCDDKKETSHVLTGDVFLI